ncbi:MAG TPA: Do family serine endopeptidase [Thiothrix sp.]|nr:Do family serine endopeptidase [Thiothrix sp.]
MSLFMNKRFVYCMTYSLVVIFLMIASRLSFAVELPNFTNLVKTYSPAVVNISTSYKDKGISSQAKTYGHDGGAYGFSPDQLNNKGFADDIESTSLGSGFILSADGYVVTNHHVVEGANKIIVRLNDRREFIAKLIGSDIRSDIAVLKVDAHDLPVLTIDDTPDLEVGEWVVAIGSPYGFDHSVTAGIVSAKQRSLPSESYVPFIQTDVAINPGNSGGPLFNIKGEVIGINSQIYSRTGGSVGLSFAIPIDVVVSVVEQLKSKGKVRRGWLGVRVQEVTREIKHAFNLDKIQGALVNEVFAGSPAENILQVGDVIVEFDGAFVPRVSALPVMVGKADIGKALTITLLRKGKRTEVELVLKELVDVARTEKTEELPKVVNNEKIVLGMTIANLSDAMRKSSAVKTGGAWVNSVRTGTAASAGILVGDVILMFDGQMVKNARQLLTWVKTIAKGDSIPVLIRRKDTTRFVVLNIE